LPGNITFHEKLPQDRDLKYILASLWTDGMRLEFRTKADIQDKSPALFVRADETILLLSPEIINTFLSTIRRPFLFPFYIFPV
jgi:hypothetical protein